MNILLGSIFLSLLTPYKYNSKSCTRNRIPLYSFADTCKTGKDKLTGRTVYLTADVEPKCEGGKAEFMRRVNRSITFPDSVSSNELESEFIVAFVVEANGKISGERVVHDNTNKVGQQLLRVVKTLRWLPGKCNGRNVAMLYRLPVIIDFSEN
jgi:outer membrane biosynthesis protein TonB